MRKEKISAFDVINVLILCICAVLVLIPFMHLFAKSVSNPDAVIKNQVKLLPVGMQWDTYKYVLGSGQFRHSFASSLFLCVVGTVCSTLTTIMVAYPLSKKDFVGRKFFLNAWLIVWLLAPSIVPVFFMMKSLHLINSLWSVIFVDLVYCFNMLIVKTFFEGMPESLAEAAKIEGAGNARILFTIMLPLAMPVVATIIVYSVFGYWNAYFNPMIFITRPEIKPLQVYIYDLVFTFISGGTVDPNSMSSSNAAAVPDVIRSATVFISVVPILCIYPFVQKYYVKGMLVGAVKG